jgi:hypothetical protein
MADPSSIANLVAWYKADQLALADGTAVGSWTDSSGVTGPLVGSAGSRPTFKTNIQFGLPVVRFDGVANGLRTSGNLTIDAYTTFIACNPAAGASGQNMLLEHSDHADPANHDGMYVYNNTLNNAIVVRNAALQSINTQSAGWASGAHLIESRYGGAGTKLSIAKDSHVLSTSASANLSAASTAQPLNVGSRGQASLFCQVDMFEIAIYSRLLSSAEIASVEDWMARWLQLSGVAPSVSYGAATSV